MKIGDKIYSKKVRPNDTAEIKVVKVKKKFNKDTNQTEIRTKYIAEYEDGTNITFYGFNINQTIFKIEEFEQLTLSQLFNM